MRSVVVFEHLTLDGVMQAPGRADEDRRGGFEHGGWATLWDPVIGGVAEASMASRPALLFGRRTYEDFYGFWPQQTDNPFTHVLNNSQKYVASRTLEEPLPWSNSSSSPVRRRSRWLGSRSNRDAISSFSAAASSCRRSCDTGWSTSSCF